MDTPFIDTTTIDPDQDKEPKGILASCAASILMKLLYTARLARFDLLKAITTLASRLTTWTRRCDKQLTRLVDYVHSTATTMKLEGYIGDKPEDLRLQLFTDADFAGCLSTRKSTSGLFLALVGPHTFFPLTASSKKQTAVSHSTPEAEIVAAECWSSNFRFSWYGSLGSSPESPSQRQASTG